MGGIHDMTRLIFSTRSGYIRPGEALVSGRRDVDPSNEARATASTGPCLPGSTHSPPHDRCIVPRKRPQWVPAGEGDSRVGLRGDSKNRFGKQRSIEKAYKKELDHFNKTIRYKGMFFKFV